MSNNNDKDKSKEELQFSPSTKINEPNVDSLMTSSTAKNTLHKRSNSDSVVPRDANKLLADKIGIVFHGDRRKDTNNNTADYKFKCACVYWRHGFSLPENGRLYLTSDTLSFKGIVGTKLSFHLNEINLTITSRMGGLVQDAFAITKVVGGSNKDNNGDSDNNNNKFLFSTVLKDRKKVIDKVQLAIANAKLQREEDEFDAISGPKKKKEKKFRMPADKTLGKMSIIGQKKLKGVSLQDYYEVAVSLYLYVQALVGSTCYPILKLI